MTRACSPGGHFNTDFETQAISSAAAKLKVLGLSDSEIVVLSK